MRLDSSDGFGPRASAGDAPGYPTAGEAIEEGFEIYRAAAASDWQRQVELDEQIADDHMRAVQQQHERTRKRVRLKF